MIYNFYNFSHANDLGLSKFDIAIGGLPNVNKIRLKSETVADEFLKQHHNDLKDVCLGSYNLSVSYSLSQKIRSLGYRSSFYYYCWNIYLPYLLESQTGKQYIIVAQCSDSKKGNTHDPEKFHVVRVIIIDKNGNNIRMIE